MTNLILLSYGSEQECRRSTFCLISFLAHCRDISQVRINLFTDRMETFTQFLKGVAVDYHFLTPDMLQEMLGGADYIHRRKIAVIDRIFHLYPEDNILFVDSDTFFVADPLPMIQNIRSGSSFMHLREYTFKQGLDLFRSFNQSKEPEAFIRFIESQPLQISGKLYSVDRNDYCWNSGVLGLSPSVAYDMPDVFALSSAFYQHSHWFISEQLAFSLVLDKTTTIHASDSYVVHYWGKRQKLLVDQLLSQSSNQLCYSASKHKAYQKLTRGWKNEIVNDILKEKAVIALSNNSWIYGIKRALLAILKDPSNISLFKEVWIARR